jgi:hypothetical protein
MQSEDNSTAIFAESTSESADDLKTDAIFSQARSVEYNGIPIRLLHMTEMPRGESANPNTFSLLCQRLRNRQEHLVGALELWNSINTVCKAMFAFYRAGNKIEYRLFSYIIHKNQRATASADLSIPSSLSLPRRPPQQDSRSRTEFIPFGGRIASTLGRFVSVSSV